MKSILDGVRRQLKRASDQQTKIIQQRFFKEETRFYGVKSAVVSKIAKIYDKEVLALSKDEVFSLCEQLWQSGLMEESFIACHWSYIIHKNYEMKDMLVFEKWINKYISNWASCDTFCNHSVGSLVELYPQFLENLKIWAKSENRWTKRAAAVSLIVPARNGKFLKDIFEIADILLLDSDDLVQKGYGWLLKVASQSHQKEVFEYVMKNKSKMPRTALRYAIEKMPKELKSAAMKK